MRRIDSFNLPSNVFSLLAVLASMMGSLVLLLVVISNLAQRSAREQAAISAAVASTPQQTPMLPRLVLPALPPPADIGLNDQQQLALSNSAAELAIETVEPKSAELARSVAQQQHVQAQLRAESKKLDDEIARLIASKARNQNELEQLKTKIVARQQELTKQSWANEEKQRTLAAHKAEQDQLLTNIAQAKRTIEQGRNHYTILPYLGRNGTQRTPIYLECNGDDIVLADSRVRLSADRIAESQQADNLLLVVLEAIIAGQGSVRNDQKMYPLLVVRPNGIRTYYLAKSILELYAIDHGYELIPDQVIVQYPKVDDKTHSAIASVVTGYERSRGLAGGNRQAQIDLIQHATSGPEGDQLASRSNQPGQRLMPISAGKAAVAELEPVRATQSKYRPSSNNTARAPSAPKPASASEHLVAKNPMMPRTALALIVRAQSIELALTGDRIEFGPNSSPEKIRASVNGLIREIIDPEDTGITVLPTLRLFIDPSAMNTYYRLRLTNGLPDWPTTTEVLRPTDKLLQTRP